MTLEEMMRDVTPLPWKMGAYEHGAAYTFSVPDAQYLIRAANAFPLLVEFVERQPCRCLWDSTDGTPTNPTWVVEQCGRCATLAAALGTPKP